MTRELICSLKLVHARSITLHFRLHTTTGWLHSKRLFSIAGMFWVLLSSWLSCHILAPPDWPTYKLWSTGKMVKTCWLVTEGREALPSQFVCVEPKLLLWAEQCKHAEDSWVNINKVKLKWIFLITFFKVSTEHWQIGQIEHGLNYIKKLFEGLCQT